ncbi:MAG TPA: hypothetical protein VLG71_02930, partial [Candidatus Limnocylindria bacterium]|nr:hypothetical protein [Candidatus Limnocylindria bacterium]
MTPLILLTTLIVSLTPSLTYSAAPQTPAERAAKEIARVQAERRKKEDDKRAKEREKRDKEEADRLATAEKEKLEKEKAKQASDAYKAAQYARAQWTKEQEEAEQRVAAPAQKNKQAQSLEDDDELGEEPVNVEAIIAQQLKEDKAKGAALQPASTTATTSAVSAPVAGPAAEQKKSRVPSLQEMIVQQHGAEMAQQI